MTEQFTLILVPTDGQYPPIDLRVRRLLKLALRQCGLKALEVKSKSHDVTLNSLSPDGGDKQSAKGMRSMHTLRGDNDGRPAGTD